jgi:hypothetical protein
MRPVSDVGVNLETELSELWFRPEGVVGYWRRDGELHLQLGTARKVLDGVRASLVEGVLTNGEYVRVEPLVEKFAPLVDWAKFIPELKAVGLVVRESDLPVRWLSRSTEQS